MYKCEKYMKSHFPEVISTKMIIGNEFLFLNTRLSVNKKYQSTHYFIEIYETV